MDINVMSKQGNSMNDREHTHGPELKVSEQQEQPHGNGQDYPQCYNLCSTSKRTQKLKQIRQLL